VSLGVELSPELGRGVIVLYGSLVQRRRRARTSDDVQRQSSRRGPQELDMAKDLRPRRGEMSREPRQQQEALAALHAERRLGCDCGCAALQDGVDWDCRVVRWPS
jgi:hypothetical protein